MPRDNASRSARASRSSATSSPTSCPGSASTPVPTAADDRIDPIEAAEHFVAELDAESTSLVVGGLDDPPTRRNELLDPIAGSRLESGVHDRKTRRRRDARDELVVVEHGDVMDQDHQGCTGVVDRGDDPTRLQCRDLDRTAGLVDVALLRWHPVADDEVRIAKRSRQLVTQRRRPGLATEVDDEAGDHSCSPPAAQEIDDQQDHGTDDDQVVRPQDLVRSTPVGDPVGGAERERSRQCQGGNQRRDAGATPGPGRAPEHGHRHERDRHGDGQRDSIIRGERLHERDHVHRRDGRTDEG